MNSTWTRRTAPVITTLAATGMWAFGPTLGGAQGVASASVSTQQQAAPAVDCQQQTPADARLRPDHHVEDPNSVTAAQAAAYESDLQARVAQRGLESRAAAQAATPVTIDVRVHVIARDNGTGGVSRKMVNDQIAVLNKAYAGGGGSAATGFKFKIASYEVTKNTDWYNWTTSDDDGPAKRALHQGAMDDLNLYIANLGSGLLGYATFPQAQASPLDGVVVLGASLPGGSASPYNKGDTATHEIGHWLGLYHTFQNGCSAPGDMVNDTPYQDDGSNIFDCIESDNTCPQPGLDPVHNYMSYGDDACLNQFTKGQATRMRTAWLAYRDPSA